MDEFDDEMSAEDLIAQYQETLSKGGALSHEERVLQAKRKAERKIGVKELPKVDPNPYLDIQRQGYGLSNRERKVKEIFNKLKNPIPKLTDTMKASRAAQEAGNLAEIPSVVVDPKLQAILESHVETKEHVVGSSVDPSSLGIKNVTPVPKKELSQRVLNLPYTYGHSLISDARMVGIGETATSPTTRKSQHKSKSIGVDPAEAWLEANTSEPAQTKGRLPIGIKTLGRQAEKLGIKGITPSDLSEILTTALPSSKLQDTRSVLQSYKTFSQTIASDVGLSDQASGFREFFTTGTLQQSPRAVGIGDGRVVLGGKHDVTENIQKGLKNRDTREEMKRLQAERELKEIMGATEHVTTTVTNEGDDSTYEVADVGVSTGSTRASPEELVSQLISSGEIPAEQGQAALGLLSTGDLSDTNIAATLGILNARQRNEDVGLALKDEIGTGGVSEAGAIEHRIKAMDFQTQLAFRNIATGNISGKEASKLGVVQAQAQLASLGMSAPYVPTLSGAEAFAPSGVVSHSNVLSEVIQAVGGDKKKLMGYGVRPHEGIDTSSAEEVLGLIPEARESKTTSSEGAALNLAASTVNYQAVWEKAGPGEEQPFGPDTNISMLTDTGLSVAVPQGMKVEGATPRLGDTTYTYNEETGENEALFKPNITFDEAVVQHANLLSEMAEDYLPPELEGSLRDVTKEQVMLHLQEWITRQDQYISYTNKEGQDSVYRLGNQQPLPFELNTLTKADGTKGKGIMNVRFNYALSGSRQKNLAATFAPITKEQYKAMSQEEHAEALTARAELQKERNAKWRQLLALSGAVGQTDEDVLNDSGAKFGLGAGRRTQSAAEYTESSRQARSDLNIKSIYGDDVASGFDLPLGDKSFNRFGDNIARSNQDSGLGVEATFHSDVVGPAPGSITDEAERGLMVGEDFQPQTEEDYIGLARSFNKAAYEFVGPVYRQEVGEDFIGPAAMFGPDLGVADKDFLFEGPEQRTEAWFEARKGLITGTQAKGLLRRSYDKEAVAAQVVTDRAGFGKETSFYQTPAAYAGTQQEENIRDRLKYKIEKELGRKVKIVEAPLVKGRGKWAMGAASPDGLVLDSKTGEVLATTEYKYFDEGSFRTAEEDIMPQVQMTMGVTEAPRSFIGVVHTRTGETNFKEIAPDPEMQGKLKSRLAEVKGVIDKGELSPQKVVMALRRAEVAMKNGDKQEKEIGASEESDVGMRDKPEDPKQDPLSLSDSTEEEQPPFNADGPEPSGEDTKDTEVGASSDEDSVGVEKVAKSGSLLSNLRSRVKETASGPNPNVAPDTPDQTDIGTSSITSDVGTSSITSDVGTSSITSDVGTSVDLGGGKKNAQETLVRTLSAGITPEQLARVQEMQAKGVSNKDIISYLQRISPASPVGSRRRVQETVASVARAAATAEIGDKYKEYPSEKRTALIETRAKQIAAEMRQEAKDVLGAAKADSVRSEVMSARREGIRNELGLLPDDPDAESIIDARILEQDKAEKARAAEDADVGLQAAKEMSGVSGPADYVNKRKKDRKDEIRRERADKLESDKAEKESAAALQENTQQLKTLGQTMTALGRAIKVVSDIIENAGKRTLGYEVGAHKTGMTATGVELLKEAFGKFGAEELVVKEAAQFRETQAGRYFQTGLIQKSGGLVAEFQSIEARSAARELSNLAASGEFNDMNFVEYMERVQEVTGQYDLSGEEINKIFNTMGMSSVTMSADLQVPTGLGEEIRKAGNVGDDTIAEARKTSEKFHAGKAASNRLGNWLTANTPDAIASAAGFAVDNPVLSSVGAIGSVGWGLLKTKAGRRILGSFVAKRAGTAVTGALAPIPGSRIAAGALTALSVGQLYSLLTSTGDEQAQVAEDMGVSPEELQELIPVIDSLDPADLQALQAPEASPLAAPAPAGTPELKSEVRPVFGAFKGNPFETSYNKPKFGAFKTNPFAKRALPSPTISTPTHAQQASQEKFENNVEVVVHAPGEVKTEVNANGEKSDWFGSGNPEEANW